jgi:mannan endo-1,4-beta-mannosidase
MRKIILFVSIACLVTTSCKQQPQSAKEQKMPTDSLATQATVDLYNRLFTLLDKGIMVGHQDDLAYGHSWYREEGRSDVKDVTGDYPAVTGWELGHLETGKEFNLDSIYFADMKRYIIETYNRGGIATASWHGDNIVTGNTAWDCAQDSVVRTILPGGSNHSKFLTWLDRLAAFFLELKDAKGELVPLVFRPYHEHTGAWFWWGSKQCTPGEYKQLWRMTVEYLRYTKNVHNLLYAYSPSETAGEAAYLERYPGDNYVDIIGFDSYVQGADSAAIASYRQAMERNLQIINAYAEKSGKIPTISETGMESVADSLYYTQVVYPVISKYKASWILFWRNAWRHDMPNHFYVPYTGQAAAGDFKTFVKKQGILLNSDIK